MPECKYCGENFDAIHIHKMKCVAEQVSEEQAKNIEGIADEIESISRVYEHGHLYEDVVEQLRWIAEKHQEELSDELEEEVKVIDS